MEWWGREGESLVHSQHGGSACYQLSAYTLSVCTVALENTLGNSDVEKEKGHSMGTPRRYVRLHNGVLE